MPLRINSWYKRPSEVTRKFRADPGGNETHNYPVLHLLEVRRSDVAELLLKEDIRPVFRTLSGRRTVR